MALTTRVELSSQINASGQPQPSHPRGNQQRKQAIRVMAVRRRHRAVRGLRIDVVQHCGVHLHTAKIAGALAVGFDATSPVPKGTAQLGE